MRIVPAILTDSLVDLRSMLDIAAGFCDYAQIDFMDGHFVPSTSIKPEYLREVRLPLAVEAHLMVQEPDNLEIFAELGFKQIIFHFEATARPLDMVRYIRSLGLLAGMAVNPRTPLGDFIDIAKHLDTLMVMTVDPGFYGSKYQPEALAKAASLRTKLEASSTVPPSLGVDGGITTANIRETLAARLDFVCVGSAIFHADNPVAAYSKLEAALA